MSSSRFPYLDFESTLPFAHRGGTSEHPENTMAAFQHAVDLGYRYLETDVHATADGVLVAFHDSSLDRVTNMAGEINDLPWSEVRNARIGDSEPIPLMEDLLQTFPAARFNIDIKASSSIQPLAALLADTQSVDRVCVGSFSDFRLKAIRDLVGPRLCTSLGPIGIFALRLASFGPPIPSLESGTISGACAQVPVTSSGIPVTDRRFIEAAHERDIDVHVWTVDDPQEMTRLLDLGVDGLMTDKPNILKDILVNRNDWSE